MTTPHTTPGTGLGLSDQLGLLPGRARQPNVLTLAGACFDDEEQGHWYSPAAVREMLAEQRKRCAEAVRALPPHVWVDGSDQWGQPCPARVPTTREQYAQACERA